MCPKPLDWSRSLPAAIFKVLVGILFVPAFFANALARPAERVSSPSTSTVYDSESFVRELARLRTELQATRKSPEALRAFRESIPRAWTVEDGGRRFDVSAGLLVSRLLTAEKSPEVRQLQLDRARDYLDALAGEAASLSGRPRSLPDSARAKLDAILARPEFAHARKRTWWEEFRARVEEALGNALGRILRSVGGQKSLGQALLWIAIFAAAILIAYWIFQRWFRTARTVEMTLQAASSPARSWQEWIFAAREAASKGDYRLAIHCAYWAGIARLQDAGALSPDRSKTPREYLRALGKSQLVMPDTQATRQQALFSLTSRLEKVWYGYQPATEADFHDSLSRLETLGCQLR